jgi:Arc/MetJ-type ribon-helix-helix transcriptional regulator
MTNGASAAKGPDMHGHHNHRRGRSEASRDDSTGERTTTRVQLEMPPQAMERLQRLKEKTEAASYAEVIRSALRLFEALVEEHEKGSEFALKRADGEMMTYKIFV